MLINKPIVFTGTEEQAKINRQTHDFVSFDGLNFNCSQCDCKPWHAAAKYPCGEKPPRKTVEILLNPYR